MKATMNIAKSKVAILAVGAMMLYVTPLSAEVTVPNKFQSGNTAKAEQVNANFTALKEALDQALTLIDEQSTRIDELEQQTDNLRAMNEHVSVVADASQPNEQRIVFEGVNLQLIDGAGKTAQENNESNGLGNLIVGYLGTRDYYSVDEICSDGGYDNQTDCTTNGGTWAKTHHSGSHNVVIGHDNTYSANGGLVVGERSAVTGETAVSFGLSNVARGHRSMITGGRSNIASGDYASVSGGFNNEASGNYASASGGQSNTISGSRASVSGGYANEASDSYASVSGGQSNIASGRYSHIAGGNANEASALRAVVVGGNSNEASGESSAVLGGTGNNETVNEGTIPAIP